MYLAYVIALDCIHVMIQLKKKKKDEYFNQVMSNYTLKHNIKWKSIISNTSK
jgi:hypothetical protein